MTELITHTAQSLAWEMGEPPPVPSQRFRDPWAPHPSPLPRRSALSFFPPCFIRTEPPSPLFRNYIAWEVNYVQRPITGTCAHIRR
jgi:hypothetical protein